MPVIMRHNGGRLAATAILFSSVFATGIAVPTEPRRSRATRNGLSARESRGSVPVVPGDPRCRPATSK